MSLQLQPTIKFSVLNVANGNECQTEKSVPRAKRKYNRIYLDIDEPYTRSIIHHALASRHFLVTLGAGEGMEAVQLPVDCDFSWSEYERIHWQQTHVRASSYRIRKGLSRKAQLALYLNRHVSKHPKSVLKNAIPETVILDTWAVWENGSGANMAEFVVGSSVSASGSNNINQRQLLEQCLEPAKLLMESRLVEEAVWILKGSTVNKGVGIYLVHVYEQILDICWSESDIREWVLQRYIANPLTLRKRKFHIRAYIVAVGALQVYFSNDCLALMSGTAYRQNDFDQLTAHITNTAYQEIDPNFSEKDCVHQWGSDAVLTMLMRDGTCQDIHDARSRSDKVLLDMHAIVSELFRAYETEFGVFSPMEDCFEHFGLDFVIDTEWQVYLLEVNPGPDFKQTGKALQSVVENLMQSTIDVTLFEHSSPPLKMGSLTCVYDKKRKTIET
ncbi:hypothetical protein MPSEU_000386100 [Mayamaea pseudoterrestris]|nr:hypothetical protein MPSEU_000386100 [Mayamaea pseudoterrestris]